MSKRNDSVTFKGQKLTLRGAALREGARAPQFVLSAKDLSDLRSESFSGKVLIISVVPSLDTPVCSLQTKRFNNAAMELADNVAILTVSMDLPFAQQRWCGAEGVQRLTVASDYKYRGFGADYGVYIEELGLLSRAVFVIDVDGKLAHVEYVEEVTNEPDYGAALAKVAMLTDR